jgi:DNA-binding sugar fermentation-stimulating protein
MLVLYEDKSIVVTQGGQTVFPSADVNRGKKGVTFLRSYLFVDIQFVYLFMIVCLIFIYFRV